jgi:hypothetical protein
MAESKGIASGTTWDAGAPAEEMAHHRLTSASDYADVDDGARRPAKTLQEGSSRIDPVGSL